MEMKSQLPSPLVIEKGINIRAGTKTSLRKPRGLVAAVYLCWLAGSRPGAMVCTEGTKEKEYTDPKISGEVLLWLEREIPVKFPNVDWSVNDLGELLNQSPLVQTQIESLKMAIEVIWRLGFIDNGGESERTSVAYRFRDGTEEDRIQGNRRAPRTIEFSHVMDALDAVVFADGEDDTSGMSVILSWLGVEDMPIADLREKAVLNLLASFSDQAVVKIKSPGSGEDLHFTTAEVYEKLGEGHPSVLSSVPVDSGKPPELVGGHRVLNSLIGSGMHPHLTKDKSGYRPESSDDVESLRSLAARSKTSFRLNRLDLRELGVSDISDDERSDDSMNNDINETQHSFDGNNEDRHDRFEQIIFFGPPGTGKSFTADKEVKKLGCVPSDVIRVTVHPEYSYADFVGFLKPVGRGGASVSYDFVPGTFTLALAKAHESPEKPVALVVEEITRGDSSAIFGDLFQLLDREVDGDRKGWSTYSIHNSDISSFIATNLGLEDGSYGSSIALPPNLSLLCTANTSDQNVKSMDGAFKRRFSFKYIGPNPIEGDGPDGYINNPTISVSPGRKMTWVNFFTRLNTFMVGALNLPEDRQIGPVFLTFDDDHDTAKQVRDKLLSYLWDEVRVQGWSEVSLFSNSIKSFGELYSKYPKMNVWSDRFLAHLDGTE